MDEAEEDPENMYPKNPPWHFQLSVKALCPDPFHKSPLTWIATCAPWTLGRRIRRSRFCGYSWRERRRCLRSGTVSLCGSVRTPGFDWADNMALWAHDNGRAMAEMNLNFHLIDQKAVRATFAHVTPAEAGVLRVGVTDSYRIIGTVGKDISDFMRRELTSAVVQGIPTLGPGSLAERLFESGRLKPLKIVGKDGKLYTRTVEQRAVAIARVESAKIAQAVSEVKITEVLGEEAVYTTINPEDDRTTPICLQASQQPAMTMAEWRASKWGVPPRLEPQFHLCRSHLLGGTKAMFKAAGYKVAA